MLRKAHTDRNQCRRCCGKRHPVHRLLRNLRQMPARHTPARADDDAENNRVFKDVDEGMHELPGVDFPARFSEFHTSRGRCPKQQNVKNNDERNRGDSLVAEAHLHNGNTELHVVAENAAHAGNDLA